MNNYSDYYGYMNNYTTNPRDMLGYQNIPNMNYQNFDNNTFSNTFMTPTSNSELFEPKEGLEKGNLFVNLYDKYKNYKPEKLKGNTEREKLLNEILSYGFAMTDLDLYLDLYSNNTSYVNLYNEYRKRKEQLCKEYEKKYGPLNLTSDALENNNWIWIKSPWPWEGNK